MKTETKRKLLSIVFPEKCPYCGDAVIPCDAACADCLENLPLETHLNFAGGKYSVISALPYDGKYKDAILKVKFGKKTQYAYQLAKLMAERFLKEFSDVDFDVIAFVPLHPVTFKERGFNQSELLAQSLSEFTGIPCKALLKKTRKTKPQHEVYGNERAENVKGVFRATDKAFINGKKILIVDDIITTGFTLAECADTLEKCGAGKISGITFAVTLPKTT